jgi:arginine/lysine/ornithine decarboxylase
VFGADRTYFVLNGTTTANKVVTNAILRRGDLVLFDRNNHKSLHQGALVQAGAIPIFLPTARNPFGMIGPVDWDAWDEEALRERIRAHPMMKDPERHKAKRPFRLACIQLATYDGTVYNVRKVLEKIGQLCDYVLWDEAWIGYNAFHPLFNDHSPMRLKDLGPEMAGLFSTQSVHKQGAGFSQASQIHKRDEHIRGQRRYVEHKRFNESFLMNASTSPFYPLFAALDVNAKVHEGKAGEMLWDRCIELGIETRKKLREFCRHYATTGRSAEEAWFFDPFVPDVVTIRKSSFTPDVTGVAWEDLPTDVIKREQQCWTFDPKSAWHGYAGIAANYAMVDPNKLMLLTPGIDRKTGAYLDFGVPATGNCKLPARATHRSREVRPQQHPVPDDAGGGREQTQRADREARQVQESVGSRRRAWGGSADAVCSEPRAICRILDQAGLQGDARLLSPGKREGAAEAVLPRQQLPGVRDDVEGRL